MDFMQVVEQRRAVRQYRASPVGEAVIQRLIGTALLAPSAMNIQPWSFAVVCEPKQVDEYGRRAKEYLLANPSSLPLPAEGLRMFKDPHVNIFHHAPALIVVMAKSDSSQAREDCCLAAQTLMLAARNEGLGTCWIGLGRPWLDLPATKAGLGLPLEYHVVAPIVIGYPLVWPETHGRNAAEIHWVPANALGVRFCMER